MKVSAIRYYVGGTSIPHLEECSQEVFELFTRFRPGSSDTVYLGQLDARLVCRIAPCPIWSRQEYQLAMDALIKSLTAMWPGYGTQLSFDDPDSPPAPYHPKLALNERKCRKCKNCSLRAVVMPDTGYPVAFCKYCGTQEEL